MQTSMLHAVTEVLALGEYCDRPAPDDVYRASDGFVAITCRDESHWQRLVDILGRPPSLADPRLATRRGRIQHSERLRAALNLSLAQRPAAAWALELSRAGIPSARALHDEDAIQRRELWRWQMLRDLPLDHDAAPLVAGGPPWRFTTTPLAPRAPTPGSATQTIRAQPQTFWTTVRPGSSPTFTASAATRGTAR